MAASAISVKAIVLKEISYKDTDKLLTVLTDRLGLITLRCRGVRSLKSRRFASSQQFVYSDMVLSEKRGQYSLEEAEPIESFFALRSRFEAIAMANYFADVISSVTVEGEDEGAILSLLLNSLYLLCEKPDEPFVKIKAVFELRLAALIGFLPTGSLCGECGKEEGLCWFNIAGGVTLCDTCALSQAPDVLERVLVPIDEGTLALVRYITTANDRRIFAFRCEERLLSTLGAFSEKYLLYHLGRSFDTLTFLQSVIE